MAVQAATTTATETVEEQGWCVVQTNRQFERMVKAALERLGFECYLPVRLVHLPKNNATAPFPLFPGYIFVRVGAIGDRWRPIFSTFGVRGVLGKTGAHPQTVAHHFIGAIMKAEAEMLAAFAQQRPDCPFQEGDEVTTLDGLIRGVFLERLDTNRCAILTRLLGSDVRRVEADIARCLASS